MYAFNSDWAHTALGGSRTNSLELHMLELIRSLPFRLLLRVSLSWHLKWTPGVWLSDSCYYLCSAWFFWSNGDSVSSQRRLTALLYWPWSSGTPSFHWSQKHKHLFHFFKNEINLPNNVHATKITNTRMTSAELWTHPGDNLLPTTKPCNLCVKSTLPPMLIHLGNV